MVLYYPGYAQLSQNPRGPLLQVQELVLHSQGGRGAGFLLVPPNASREVRAARLQQELQDVFFKVGFIFCRLGWF